MSYSFPYETFTGVPGWRDGPGTGHVGVDKAGCLQWESREIRRGLSEQVVKVDFYVLSKSQTEHTGLYHVLVAATLLLRLHVRGAHSTFQMGGVLYPPCSRLRLNK